ncbi:MULTISPECIES: rod-determining factor RdfA [Halostella]|uniref:rod-determining factor RdfA n=1 Tax=Halostella TaxID=1843185 RepID=UPI00108087B2|nr:MULTISPECIES: rod-determining factor RdfA [Halostella]
MPTDPGCKVDLVVDQYGLESADPAYESIDDGLLARWKGTDDRTQMGYRSLTEWFNKRLLKQVYDEHGRDALGARVDSDYEALRSDDDLVSEEMVESLLADGIDGERVREDMVSYGTMRTHLKDCLDGEKPPQTAETEWERESLEMAREVTREKAERALSSLETKGRIDGVETSTVEVQIQISCGSCPTRVPFEVAAERGYVCEQHDQTHVTSD